MPPRTDPDKVAQVREKLRAALKDHPDGLTHPEIYTTVFQRTYVRPRNPARPPRAALRRPRHRNPSDARDHTETAGDRRPA